jgi:cystathionine beta-lyase/cystathionine gamma-synthase
VIAYRGAWGTYGFLRHVAAWFGCRPFVDLTDLDRRAAVLAGNQIVAGTVANPTTAVADPPTLAEIAHAHGALLVVDSTMAPPVICRPLEHGADLVLHSATKYLGGHSDTTGGVVSGAPGLISQVRAVRVDTGGALAPDEAFLLRRGLETLPLRVRRQCSTAMLFAAAVAGHPAVCRVDYPGLPGHPGHQTAIRLYARRAGRRGTVWSANDGEFRMRPLRQQYEPRDSWAVRLGGWLRRWAARTPWSATWHPRRTGSSTTRPSRLRGWILERYGSPSV